MIYLNIYSIAARAAEAAEAAWAVKSAGEAAWVPRIATVEKYSDYLVSLFRGLK
jgi:hypothetical protein